MNPVLRAEIPDETLDRVAAAPTTFPACVLRAVACEYRLLRESVRAALTEMDLDPVVSKHHARAYDILSDAVAPSAHRRGEER